MKQDASLFFAPACNIAQPISSSRCTRLRPRPARAAAPPSALANRFLGGHSHQLHDTQHRGCEVQPVSLGPSASTPPHLQQAIRVPYSGGGAASEAVAEEHRPVVSEALSSLPPAVGLPPVVGRSHHWKMLPSSFRDQNQPLPRSSLPLRITLTLPFHPSHVWRISPVTRGSRLGARSMYCTRAGWRVSKSLVRHISRSFESTATYFHHPTSSPPPGPASALTTPSSQCRPTAIRIATTSTAQRCGFYPYPPCCLCFVHRQHLSDHHDVDNSNKTFHDPPIH